MPNAVIISGAVEGLVDEAVLRRLIQWAGAAPGTIYGKHGKPFLRKEIEGYNRAAHLSRWIVLVDLDHDADCLPAFLKAWLPDPAPGMCFRIVVREIEAWLIADAERLANFLNVSVSLIPHDPEALPDPKHTMIGIARASRRKDIREDMAPRVKSCRKVGPAYNSRLIQFVNDTKRGWRPEVAARFSDSLNRCLRRLEQLVAATV
jgi:hypothetical protein